MGEKGVSRMAAATYMASLRDTVLARALQRKRINRIQRERDRDGGLGGISYRN